MTFRASGILKALCSWPRASRRMWSAAAANDFGQARFVLFKFGDGHVAQRAYAGEKLCEQTHALFAFFAPPVVFGRGEVVFDSRVADRDQAAIRIERHGHGFEAAAVDQKSVTRTPARFRYDAKEPIF